MTETNFFTLAHRQHYTNAQEFTSAKQMEHRHDSRKESSRHVWVTIYPFIFLRQSFFRIASIFKVSSMQFNRGCHSIQCHLKFCVKAWNHDLWNHGSRERDVAQAIPVNQNTRIIERVNHCTHEWKQDSVSFG